MTSNTSFATPDWVRDAVFYQIFPDRFARSGGTTRSLKLEPWDSSPTVHGFKGGDLYGVIERLDYLQDLGINALYFNPIFQSAANHRYHTHDYYAVDPILGGNEALGALLHQAHRRGIRVVLDGVFNHASRGFFQFHHLLENGAASPYVDWFDVNDFPLRPYHAPSGQHGYEAWWGLPALPKLNTRTEAVRQFLWDVAGYWIDFGIDGWRLDVPSEIDDDAFWQEFRRRVKGINPDAYIVGEIWGDGRRWLQGDQFDAVMNYLVARACLGFFVGDNLLSSEVLRSGYHQIDTLDAEGFRTAIQSTLDLYPGVVNEVQLNLLGSHDTPRFKTLAQGDSSAYRLATLFQMTFVGAPCIYYGDEIGMEGRHDPDCRRAFPWREDQWELDLHAFVQRCIALRHSYPALRRGDMDWLAAGASVVAYSRSLGSEIVLVCLNSGLEAAEVSFALPEQVPNGMLFKDVWGGLEVIAQDGMAQGLSIPPRSGLVLATDIQSTR
jgi:neopullulanase